MTHGFMDRFPFLLLLLCGQGVHAQLQMLHLALQTVKALQPVGVDVVAYRASGLVQVSTVAESTAGSQGSDVREGVGEIICIRPEMQLAHPGSVEEKSAAGEENDLTACGGVPALGVG